MGKLAFWDVAMVKELYEHAKKCSSHRKTYGESTGPGLWLVHDQGVYLMSPGIPALTIDAESEKYKVTYAKGCDPQLNKDWWDEARDLVGGDDFVEHIPIETWDAMFSRKKPLLRVEINVSDESIEVVALELIAPCRLPLEPVGAKELDDIV